MYLVKNLWIGSLLMGRETLCAEIADSIIFGNLEKIYDYKKHRNHVIIRKTRSFKGFPLSVLFVKVFGF
jgi:hypothetical protein